MPTPISIFSLKRHSGDYDSWPGKSELQVNGQPTGTFVPGYILLRQFKLESAYLIVTDFERPYEETTCFVLLSDTFKVEGTAKVEEPYATFVLKDLHWCDGQHFTVHFEGHGDRWDFTIRDNFFSPIISPFAISRTK